MDVKISIACGAETDEEFLEKIEFLKYLNSNPKERERFLQEVREDKIDKWYDFTPENKEI